MRMEQGVLTELTHNTPALSSQPRLQVQEQLMHNSSATTSWSTFRGNQSFEVEGKKKRKEDKTRVSKCRLSQTPRAVQFCRKGQRNASPSKLDNTDFMFTGPFCFTPFSVENKSCSFMALPWALGTETLLMTYRNNPLCFQDFNCTVVWFYRWI